MSGQVEYLAVRAPGGFPVSIGGIDYAKQPGAGIVWQLSTHGDLRSLGLGTALIKEAEARIKKRADAQITGLSLRIIPGMSAGSPRIV
jgi:hypothetical protein